jgi:predicted Zn-dependent peptidase
MITIYAGTSEEEIGELATLTIDELKRSAEDMTEAEIARARAQMKAGLLMGLESPSSRAERMARSLAIWGRVPSVEENTAKIEGVSRTDVLAFAENLTQATSALALYGPIEAAPMLTALRERLAA